MYREALKTCSYAKNWYRNDYEYIRKNFDDSELFAGLLSATSPRCNMARSWRVSLRVYARFKAGKSIDYSGMLPGIRGNVDRVLSGQELSGKKVRAFYQNLIGNYHEVTVDSWMLKFFKLSQKTLTPNQYDNIVNRIKRYARKIGLYPAELQAILWTYIRTLNNKNDVSYSIIAKRDQLSLF